MFPHLPARTRLFGLFAAHQDGTEGFLAAPSVLGVADSYGVEVLHPYRAQRHPVPARLRRKGRSTPRWSVGGTLAVVLTTWGLICAWGADTANGPDRAFPPLIGPYAEDMIVLADGTFARTDDNPPTRKVGPRGTWNDRMLVETTFSLLTLICHAKHALHRTWRYCTLRLAATVALFNVLVPWDGVLLAEHGCAHRSIAPFSLSYDTASTKG